MSVITSYSIHYTKLYDTYTKDVLGISNFALGTGVIGIVFDGTDVLDTCTLTKISGITDISDDKVYYTASGSSNYFRLSDHVKVCYYDGSGYTFLSLDELQQLDLSEYTVSAYYDESQLYAGRIRMIVIQ